ncbi:hypothetical protein ACO0QE_002927 [Hanseniaspora vineae]
MPTHLPPNSCLLIIDMQYDFLPPNGSLAVPDGDSIVPKIRRLISENSKEFDLIVFTQDYHPQNHISFASNHKNAKPFEKIDYERPNTTGSGTALSSSLEQTKKKEEEKPNTINSTLWPDHCVQDTRGSEIEESLLSTANTNVPYKLKFVKKGVLADREYYSCFNDIWNDHHTELNETLKNAGIKHVYCCGLALDYCVFNSALSSSKLGYQTFIVKNMTAAIDQSWELEKMNTNISYVEL